MLKEHPAGARAANLCRKHGLAMATFYIWRSKYSGMEVLDARKLRGLKEESAKLKRRTESMLDISTLKDMPLKNF